MRKFAFIVAAFVVAGTGAFAQGQTSGLQDAPGSEDEVREIMPSMYGLVGLQRAGFYVTDISSEATERTGLTKTMISDYFSRALAKTDTVSFAMRGTGVPWFHVDVRLRPLQDVQKTAYCVDLKLVQTVFVMTETRSIMIPCGAVWQAPGTIQTATDDVCAERVKTALQQAVDYFAQQYRRENAPAQQEDAEGGADETETTPGGETGNDQTAPAQ